MPKISKLNVQEMMCWVMGACLPALVFLTYWQGWGFLINLSIAIIAGSIFERKYFDGPTWLTAILFAAGVPAFAGPWVLIVGMFFAIVIAKQLFGGLGQNIFNPAMVAYAVVLVGFPSEMVVWPGWALDSISAATPLDHAHDSFLSKDLEPYFILNGLWLLGGLILLFKRIIRWIIPLSVLCGMLLSAVFFPDPLLQLGLGATMMGAFFIATDPVTAPGTSPMQCLYGLLIGGLIIAMRQFSSYPDGVAFAILLANMVTPIMDQWSTRKIS